MVKSKHKKKTSSKKTKKVQISKNLFNLTTLSVIKRTNGLKKIYKELKLDPEKDKSKISYHCKILKNKGFIKNPGYATWEITEKGKLELKRLRSSNFSLRTTRKHQTNIHALQISLPITNYNERVILRESKSYKVKNWIGHIKRIISPIGLTLEQKTRQIVVNIWSRDIPNLKDIDSLIWRSVVYAHLYCQNQGIFTDIENYKVTRIHIFMPNDKLEKIFSKGLTVGLDLNRYVKKITIRDPDKEAFAWTDNSPRRGIESNDIRYAEQYVRMPITMEEIKELNIGFNKNLSEYNKNIKLHLEVLKEMKKTLKQIRDKK